MVLYGSEWFKFHKNVDVSEMGFFETYGKAAVYKHCLYMCRGLKGLARPWIHELRYIIVLFV